MKRLSVKKPFELKAINIKGKPNPKNRSMVKLEMIFFNSNYPRVTKVVNVTGLMSDWEIEGHSWSPIQLSHAFDEVEQIQSEVRIKSVIQMIDTLEARFRERLIVKNGLLVDSSGDDDGIFGLLEQSYYLYNK